jgi:hypothetical protein
MNTFIQKHISLIAWKIAAVSLLLAIVVWGSMLDWDFTGLFETTYAIFPLLGLIAFSLMWGHYVVWALREMSGATENQTKLYTHVTQGIVLVALLLHPGLVIWQLFQDGYGLPPQSYVAAYSEALAPFIFLGTLSLFAFLSYELKRWLETKTIWKFILVANHIAMVLIIIHAFKLGTHVQSGWFRGVFVFYAVTLVLSYIYLGVKKKLLG